MLPGRSFQLNLVRYGVFLEDVTVEQYPKEALLQSYSAVSGAESLLSGHTKDFALRGLAKMNKSAALSLCSWGWEAGERARTSDG